MKDESCTAAAARSYLFGRTVAVCILTLSAVCVTSCSTIKVRMLHGKLTRESIESARDLKMLDEDTVAETGVDCLILLKRARSLEMQGRHVDAAGCYLHSVIHARDHLQEDRIDAATRLKLLDLHNVALARFAEVWSRDRRSGQGEAKSYHCGNTAFRVAVSPNSHYRAGYFDEVVATDAVKGKGVEEVEREGLGATLVGVRHRLPERSDELEYFPRRGLYVPVSATISDSHAEADGTVTVSLDLSNPMLTHQVDLGGRRYPLAADYSVPLEMILSGGNELVEGLSGFFRAATRIEESGIYLTEPYDPNRVPVIFSHGLLSSPLIWRDIIPQMQAKEDLSERYQFMVFTYPSSLTIAESSRLFRKCLGDMREKYDPEGDDALTQNMVAVGHSMGGVLTHLLVAEMGDHFWNQVSDRPLDDLGLPEAMEADIRSLAFFEPDPAVRRAIYFSTPHRGAEMAELKLANVVSRLARLPSNVFEIPANLLAMPVTADVKVDLGKKMTSVQSLRPDSPIVMALNEAPYESGIVYHSVIGDRGKGDTPDSSDGVVDYWSSHQEGAASEVIVPTGHSSYDDPKAVDELVRILRLHAGLYDR